MLSDEEKRAIDKLSSKKNETTWDNTIRQIKREEIRDVVVTRQKYITTVLNLIEKQSKEIEHQKEKRENQKQELAILNEKQKEFNKLVNTVNSYKGQFKKQQKEIEELKEKEKNLLKQIKEQEKEFLEVCEKSRNSVSKDKIKAKIEEYKKQIEKMEKDDIGRGFTLGKEWSDLKAKVEFGQSLLEKE